MKIMLDTNILISALIFGGRARETFLKLIASEHEVYVSDYVSQEFAEKIKLKWPDKAERIMAAYKKLPVCFCKSSNQMLGTLRDIKDVPVLSDALYHKVDVILTGDKDFLESDIENPIIFSLSMMNDFLKNEF